MANLKPAVVTADGKFIQPLAAPDTLDVSNIDVPSLAAEIIPSPTTGSGLKVDGNGKLVIDAADAAAVLAPELADSPSILPTLMTKAEWDGMSSGDKAATVNAFITEDSNVVATVLNGTYREFGRAVVS